MEKTKYCFITNRKQLNQLIQCCKQTGYASIDFETSGERVYNNGFYPTILGVSFEPGKAAIIPLGHFDSPIKNKWLKYLKKFGKEVLANPNITKIAWNIQFEIQVLARYSITMVGRLFDGMLAKYLLDEERPNDLKSMVTKFLPAYSKYEEDYEGCNLPWDKKPLLGLSQYCAIDCDMTLRLMLFFEKKLIDLGFYNLFRNMLMMGARVMAEVSARGQCFDIPFNDHLQGKYEKLIADKEKELASHKNVRRFMKKFIQGRVDKYIEDIQIEITEKKKELKYEKDTRKMASLKRAIDSREQKISRILAGEYTTKKELELIQPLNFGSDQQMVKLLYSKEGLGLPIIAYTKDKKTKKDTTNPSVGEDTLIKLKTDYDKSGFVAGLLDHRGLKQIYNTFVIGIRERLQDDGRIHPKFHLHTTVTGRLSSTDPNAQQYPRVATNPDVRKMLIASKGKLYLMMDYSQAELRVMAALANEKTLLKWFREGKDIHLSIACQKYHEDYDKILPIYEDENHPEYKTWKVRRKQAKTIVFGIVYEQTAIKLAESLSEPNAPVSVKEAQAFLDEFFAMFPRVRRFVQRQHDFAEEHGYVKSLFGRKRRLPGVFSDNYAKYLEALRFSTNAPCQSAASDFCLFTQILVWEKIKNHTMYSDLVQVGTVHDSIYFEVSPEYINPRLVYDLWNLAKNPDTLKWFGFQVTSVEMSMDFQIGRSQGEELSFTPGYDYQKLVDNTFDKDDYYQNYVDKYKHIPIREYPKHFPEYFTDLKQAS